MSARFQRRCSRIGSVCVFGIYPQASTIWWHPTQRSGFFRCPGGTEAAGSRGADLGPPSDPELTSRVVSPFRGNFWAGRSVRAGLQVNVWYDQMLGPG